MADPATWIPQPADRPAVRLEKAREYMRMVRRLQLRLTKLVEPLLRPHAITSTQYLVLLWVRNHAGIVQNELGEALDLDANTISDVVRRLQKRGLLQRERHATDKRAYTLAVTREGGQIVQRIRGRIDRISLHCYSMLPPGHEAAIAGWLMATAHLEKIPE